MKPQYPKTLFTGKSITLRVDAYAVASVIFNSSASRVNLLSTAVLEELELALTEIEQSRNLCGVVFCSDKADSFIVGADINEIVTAQGLPSELAFNASEHGKRVFARIAQLPIRTVAAINGRCLGGGTELALACKYRIISDSENSVIGLPEVGLGVLPGWGGTVRSCKMLGLIPALQLVLNPLKPWSAKKAWRLQLVTEVVPASLLIKRAKNICLGAPLRAYKPSLKEKLLRGLSESKLGRFIVKRQAIAKIKKETGGKYPAVFEALKVIFAALEIPQKEAMRLESETFARLLKTPESAQLVQAFLEYQRAKKGSASN